MERNSIQEWLRNKRNIFFLVLNSLDVWSLYLYFRQLEFLYNSDTVPSVLQGVITLAEYESSRHQAISRALTGIASVGARLTSNVYILHDRYPSSLWKHTGTLSGDNATRAVLFNVIDDIISNSVLIPIMTITSAYGGFGLSLTSISTAGAMWIASSAVLTAVKSYILIEATDNIGPDFFMCSAVLEEAFTIVSNIILIQFFAPMMYQPIPEGAIKATIDGVANKVGYYPQHQVYMLPSAKESKDDAPNAYHTGLLGMSMIIISETLLNIVGSKDIAGIMAHELGHWFYNHSVYSYLAGFLIDLLDMFFSMQTYGNDTIVYDVFDFDRRDPPHPIIACNLYWKYLYPLIPGFIMGARGLISNSCEYSADGFAVNLGFRRELQSALLNVISKANVFPSADKWFAAWILGHPSVLKRVEGLKNI